MDTPPVSLQANGPAHMFVRNGVTPTMGRGRGRGRPTEIGQKGQMIQPCGGLLTDNTNRAEIGPEPRYDSLGARPKKGNRENG